MKRLSWIITLPFAIVVVIFALANRQLTEVRVWPLDLSVQLPLFLTILLSLLAGFLIGAAIMWLSSGKLRQRARRAHHQISNLERDLVDAQRRLSRAETRLKDSTGSTALATSGRAKTERPAA